MFNLGKFIADSVTFRPVSMFAPDIEANAEKLTQEKKQRTKNDVKKRIEDCVFPGPIEWLKGFRDADMVFCDSFHGCVFSIIFNKPFWVFANEDRGLERFTSLLKLFSLEDRLVLERNIGTVDFNKPINWDYVNETRNAWKHKSLNFLTEAGF